MEAFSVKLPSLVNNFKLHGNLIFHTIKQYSEETYTLLEENGCSKIIKPQSKIQILLVETTKTKNHFKDHSFILQVSCIPEKIDDMKKEIECGKWIKHPDMKEQLPTQRALEKVTQSWQNNFFPKMYDSDKAIAGLRKPQIGALYSTLSHWTISKKPATVVMPTGTGKTETMLSVMVAAQASRILIVVPSNALREQISSKFISLGILPHLGVVGKVLYPVVGVLNSGIKKIDELEEFLSSCNVIVTTMSLVSGLSDASKEKIAELCNYLFIDEAHHIAAKTWGAFKSYFNNKKVLQFTATPFRNDGKYIDGKIIYNFPLAKAQEEGYFRPINFVPVEEYNEWLSDQMISEEAVKQLEQDLDAGYDHILMARVSSKKRADEVYDLYKRYIHFKPVMIYSSMPAKVQKEALTQIITRESRIIVCVNMLGEGFDLPQLKVAALHDKHKSLGITLQFIGRFTRVANGIGDASLIANIADDGISNQIQELYQQDADWNRLIQQKSKESIDHRLNIDALANNFTGEQIESLSIQEIRPKTSTVVYKSKYPKWSPEQLEQRISVLEDSWVIKNTNENILIVVQKRTTPLTWSKTRELFNTLWESSIFYWNEEKGILFVNSSANEWLDSWVKELLQDPERIANDFVFNSFYNIERLQLNTVGLNEAVKGPLRYRMYTGIDISEALSTAEKRTSVKSNIFGIGYEEGNQVSVGASYKGKVWSKSSSDLPAWVEWCNKTGEKLTDKNIKIDDIIKGVLRPRVVGDLPEMHPIAVDWPVVLFENGYFNAELKFGAVKRNLFETGIRFLFKENDRLYFELTTDDLSSKFSMRIENDRAVYEHHNGPKIEINPSTRAPSVNILKFFNENSVIFQYPDTSYLEGTVFVEVPEHDFIFDTDKVEFWDWKDVNIKRESQYVSSTNSIRKDSVQYKVIQTLKSMKKYSMIIDDDGSGEVADIITVFEKDKTLCFELYHCKYSQEENPGKRVGDLYELCGQANKSVDWRKNLPKIINHVRQREKLRNKANKRSRFEVGDHKELSILEKKMKTYDLELNVFIVQPGISKSNLTEPQLNILAATEHYLKSTFKIDFKVISSK